MLAALGGESLEAALPDMSCGFVGLAVAGNVRSKQPVHEAAKVAVLARPEAEMKVVGHQAVSQDAHLNAGAGLVKELHESVVIIGGMKNPVSGIAAINHVIA